MSSPIMVETVRNIPLIVQSRDGPVIPMDIDTGFPFDDTDFGRERDTSFRTRLDDIAKRHPEFAEHLNWGRQRTNSETKSRPSAAERFAEARHFADRPFASRFEDLSSPPFNTYQSDFPQQQKYEDKEERQSEPSCNISYGKPPTQPERGRKGQGNSNNIQQSNTIDLGQKSEPVNDRSQRSMSAPPENRSNQKFVSSINIPINRDGAGDMGARTSQPQQEPMKTNERVIPIFVEGRDEPVTPKNINQTFTSHPPQPEKIFGHSPPQFTQFLNRGDAHKVHPEEVFRQQKERQRAPFGEFGQQFRQGQQFGHPQQGHSQQFGQKTQDHQQNHSQFGQQHPQKQQQQQDQNVSQQQNEPPQQQKSKQDTPIDLIQAIQKDVLDLMTQVEQFSGKPKDKQYLYLDEMLTRNLIKLDNIDTEGKDNIRQARKEAIKCVQKCISILEAKANANQENEAKLKEDEQSMQVESVKDCEKSSGEPMEVSAESNNNTQQKTEENKVEEVQMEMSVSSPQDHNKTEEIENNKSQMEVEDGKAEVHQIEEASKVGEATDEVSKESTTNQTESIDEANQNETKQPEEGQHKTEEEKCLEKSPKAEKKDKKKIKKKEKTEKK